MIRLFIPHDLAAGAELALDPGQSRYLAAVMRQVVGDEILLFNGRDGEWRPGTTGPRKGAGGRGGGGPGGGAGVGPGPARLLPPGKPRRAGNHTRKCPRSV